MQQKDKLMRMKLTMKLSLAVAALALATIFFNTAMAQQKPAGEAGTVNLPDTPAAKTFAAFLKAFNSGDIEVMKKFHTDHSGDPGNAEKDMEFYQQSGGIKVSSIKSSSDYALEVIIETKNGGMQLSFALEVSQ